MATKKKSGIKAPRVKSDKASAKAKRDALNDLRKKKATGNTALDRANAVAKKGTAKAAKPTVEKGKAPKPQFFGRKKVTKEVDPEKVKEQRNAQHMAMMRVPWYAEHRAASIELWVARRKAIAEKDTATVEKINRKLEKINKERDKARAEWKAAGSVVPAEASAKKETKIEKAKKSDRGGKTSVKKPAAKKPAKKRTKVADPKPADVGDQTEAIGDHSTRVNEDEQANDGRVETDFHTAEPAGDGGDQQQ